MKTKKRLLALVFAATMILGMSMSAFAEGNYSIKIEQITGATEIHTYDAFQVFKGVLDEQVVDGETVRTLSNIEWGANLTGPVELNGTIYDDPKVLAKALEKLDPAEFAKEIGPKLSGAPVKSATETAVGSGVTIDGLDDGYYIVMDAKGSLDGKADAYSSYIVQVAGSSVGVKAKADVPSVEKKVKDINDTTGATSDWQDSADYDIGDDVPFQFTSKIVSNISNYVNPYIYKFHDTLSKGLTLNEDSITVTINGQDVKGSVTTEGQDFVIETVDLRSIAKADDVVVVEYTAKLNDEAICGSDGNENTMYLEYSNNPNGEGTGKTPTDKVVVFTYKVEVDKVDEDQKPLAGAEFTLEKNVGGEWVALALVKSEEGTVFTFKGLDDGDYRITETATPKGYNSLSGPIEFTVSATHDEISDSAQLTALTGVGTFDFVPDLKEGELKNAVVNQSGSILPSTGGMGTTILYIIGAILVCGAGAILFVRKKMSNY